MEALRPSRPRAETAALGAMIPPPPSTQACEPATLFSASAVWAEPLDPRWPNIGGDDGPWTNDGPLLPPARVRQWRGRFPVSRTHASFSSARVATALRGFLVSSHVNLASRTSSAIRSSCAIPLAPTRAASPARSSASAHLSATAATSAVARPPSPATSS